MTGAGQFSRGGSGMGAIEQVEPAALERNQGCAKVQTKSQFREELSV